MSNRVSIQILLLALLTNPVAAEDSFWNHIHIRHNLNTKKEIAQPAFFQITDPEGKDSSYTIGIGLKYDAYANARFDLGPFVEYQKNTLVDKEQDVLKLGLTLNWQAHCIDPSGKGCEGRKRDNGGFLLSKINYKNDQIKNEEGGQVLLDYTHAWVGPGKSGKRKFPMPNLYFPIGRVESGSETLGLLYSPSIGVEFDKVVSASEERLEGSVLRGVFSLSLRIWPVPTKLQDRLEINAVFNYREDLSDSTGDPDDGHPLFIGSLTYILLKGENPDRKIGLTLSYTDGEDPSEGFLDQSFWKFGLTIQVD